MSDETKRARQQCVDANISFESFDSSCNLSEGIIVDSLIGTGFEGVLRDEFAIAIECINSSLLPVLAVDIPSGLASDTGAVQEVAVKADITVTFVAPKQGLFTGRGTALCGDIVYDSLDIPADILQQRLPSAELMSVDDLLEYLPEPEADVHKSQRGHCMVIGGDHGTGGASLLAAQSCLQVGAGVVSHATRPEHVSASLVRQPEIMACGVVSGQELEPLLDRPTVLVVGPGLGRSSWSEQMLQKAMSMDVPMVVDADALNIIADGRVVTNIANRSWVMTPHPGEAARLLGVSVTEIETDRFAAVRKLQQKYNAVILLKGAGTLIYGDQTRPIQVCPDRKSTRLNSSHRTRSRMPSSA
jgi:NAD(P)H-hydrate epimerase